MGLDNISVIMRHRGKMLRGKGIAKSFPQLTTHCGPSPLSPYHYQYVTVTNWLVVQAY